MAGPAVGQRVVMRIERTDLPERESRVMEITVLSAPPKEESR